MGEKWKNVLWDGSDMLKNTPKLSKFTLILRVKLSILLGPGLFSSVSWSGPPVTKDISTGLVSSMWGLLPKIAQSQFPRMYHEYTDKYQFFQKCYCLCENNRYSCFDNADNIGNC